MIDHNDNCVDKCNIDNEVLNNSLCVVLQCDAWGLCARRCSIFSSICFFVDERNTSKLMTQQCCENTALSRHIQRCISSLLIYVFDKDGLGIAIMLLINMFILTVFHFGMSFIRFKKIKEQDDLSDL